jgi:hypothetical protein
MRRLLAVSTLLFVAGLSPLLALAEMKVQGAAVDSAPPASHTGAVVPSSDQATVRDNRKPGGNTLRCWQGGRLLYEGSGFRSDVDHNPAAIGIPRLAEGDPVVVLNLQHAICILSKG